MDLMQHCKDDAIQRVSSSLNFLPICFFFLAEVSSWLTHPWLLLISSSNAGAVGSSYVQLCIYFTSFVACIKSSTWDEKTFSQVKTIFFTLHLPLKMPEENNLVSVWDRWPNAEDDAMMGPNSILLKWSLICSKLSQYSVFLDFIFGLHCQRKQ